MPWWNLPSKMERPAFHKDMVIIVIEADAVWSSAVLRPWNLHYCFVFWGCGGQSNAKVFECCFIIQMKENRMLQFVLFSKILSMGILSHWGATSIVPLGQTFSLPQHNLCGKQQRALWPTKNPITLWRVSSQSIAARYHTTPSLQIIKKRNPLIADRGCTPLGLSVSIYNVLLTLCKCACQSLSSPHRD